MAVVAPTGIAAIHVQGQTIHSLFGMKATLQDVRDAKQVQLSPRYADVLRAIDTLVIDEISMVRADVMDMMDHKLRLAKRRPGVPFGGVQVIAFGDLFQLPPVTGKENVADAFLRSRYDSIFFFSAPAVKQSPFRLIELH